MKELFELFKEASVPVIALVVVVYFLKVFIENKLNALTGRVEKIAETSLNLKNQIRDEEREVLINFRIALEEWEYFLQSMLFYYTRTPLKQTDDRLLQDNDNKLYHDVHMGLIRACIYLRDRDLEAKLMDVISRVRNLYNPLIYEAIPPIIDIQKKLMPIEIKLKKYEESGLVDNTFAPTPKEAEEYSTLQNQLTAELQKYSEKLISQYPAIGEQLYDLKEAINAYIYRPIESVEIDKK